MQPFGPFRVHQIVFELVHLAKVALPYISHVQVCHIYKFFKRFSLSAGLISRRRVRVLHILELWFHPIYNVVQQVQLLGKFQHIF